MKKCGKCGNENSDEMRFCLECGGQLSDAPFVVNLQDSKTQNISDAKTEYYNPQSVNTQVNTGYAPPNYSPPNKPRGNNTKIFLAVGGVVALLVLLMSAVAAVVIYNMIPDETVENDPTPSPAPSRDVRKDSPAPESSKTPKTKTDKDSTIPASTEDNSAVTVKFDNVKVDYNVKEKNVSGMRMHVNFTVSGMKDRDGYLAIHFQNKDGEKLSADQGAFRDVNGNLAVFKTLKPDYDDTLYKDMQLFLPYDEFKLSSGRHELQMDIDLLDGKGALIEHLDLEDFWYEQK